MFQSLLVSNPSHFSWAILVFVGLIIAYIVFYVAFVILRCICNMIYWLFTGDTF